MNKILFSLVLLIALVGGAGLVHLQLSIEDNKLINNEVNANLLKIEQLNSSLNELALKNRSNLDRNYDALVSATKQITSLVTVLSEGHFSKNKITGTLLEERFDNFKSAIEVKIDHIENFKTHNSVLRNSDKYIPVVGRELIEAAENAKAYDNAGLYEDIIINTLLFARQDSDIRAQDVLIFSKEISNTEQSMPSSSFPKLLEFSNHVATISDSKVQADRYLSKALDSVANVQVEAVHSAWNELQVKNDTQQKALKNYSIAYVILMVLLFSWLINRLRGVYAGLDRQIKRKTDQIKSTYENLRQVEKRLSQSEKMASLGKLISGVAHQVNTPLEFATSNVGIVRTRIGSLIPIYQSVRNISEAILSKNYTSKMINTLLKQQVSEFNKVKETNPNDLINLLDGSSQGLDNIKGAVQTLTNYSHAESADMEDVDINKTIENVITSHSGDIVGRDIVCDFSDEILLVKAMPDQIVQVFSNILINAIEATPNDGTITIKTETVENNRVAIMIGDDGCGINPKILNKVCDPFFTTKDLDEYSGLGLSTAQQIISSHRGELMINSQIKKGTQVTVYFHKL